MMPWTLKIHALGAAAVLFADGPAVPVQPVTQTINPATEWLLNQLNACPMVGMLILLIVADIITGLISAFITKALNSNASFAGMGKKTLMVIFVGVGYIIERIAAGFGPYDPGIPIAKLIASFYCITEALSIIENLDRAGVPVPSFLKISLQKHRTDMEQVPAQQITIQHAANVNMPAAAVPPHDNELGTKTVTTTTVTSEELKTKPQDGQK